MLEFEPLAAQPSVPGKIKMIGIGGCGCNMIAGVARNLEKDPQSNIELYAVHDDKLILQKLNAENLNIQTLPIGQKTR